MTAKDLTLGPSTKISIGVLWTLLVLAVGGAATGTKLLADIRGELRAIRESQYTRGEMDVWAANLQGANWEMWVPHPTHPDRRVLNRVNGKQ